MNELERGYRADRRVVRWWSLVLVLAAVGQGNFLLLVFLFASPALAALGVVFAAISLFLGFLSGVRYGERVRSLGIVGRWTAIGASEASASRTVP